MSKLVTSEFTLTVPSNWVDRSMITWVAPAAPNRQINPNILCGKDVLKPNQNLDQYVNFQVKSLINEVEGFELVTRDNLKFGKTDAVTIVFKINPQGIMLRQQQIYFVSDQKKGQISSIVATAADMDFDKFKPTFDDIFKSLKWN